MRAAHPPIPQYHRPKPPISLYQLSRPFLNATDLSHPFLYIPLITQCICLQYSPLDIHPFKKMHTFLQKKTIVRNLQYEKGRYEKAYVERTPFICVLYLGIAESGKG
jgi:hypothetical protein